MNLLNAIANADLDGGTFYEDDATDEQRQKLDKLLGEGLIQVVDSEGKFRGFQLTNSGVVAYIEGL